MSTLTAALTAAERGFKVIRLQPGSKIPATAWRGHETTDPETIRAWFTHNAAPNYGIVADASGLVILDEDTPGDLVRWATDHNTTVPPTLTVTTGRGKHYYFRDGGHPFSNETPFRRDGYDIDVRGHGYVVGPGSIHAETGVIYTADDTTPATIPDTLRHYLTHPPRRAQERQETPHTPTSTAALIGRSTWQETGVRGVLNELSALQSVPLGHEPRWDRATFAHACRLIELANYDPATYSLEAAHTDFIAHAPTDATFGPEQHEHKWDTARRHVGTRAAQPTEHTPTPPAPPSTPPAGETDRFAPLSWADVLEGPPPQEDWLIYPLIERGQSVSIYSAPKVGKSLLILELVARLSASQTTLGHTPPRPVRTLYLDAENTPRDLRGRLHALNMSAADLGNLIYLSFPPLQPLDTTAGTVALIDLVERHRPDLLVIDTISRFIDGGENDSDTWLAVYSKTLVHLKARGIAVLRLDHEGKDGDRGERGSSAKNGDVDASWRLTYDENRRTRTLTRKLTRTGNGPERLTLDVTTNPLRHELSTSMLTDPVAPVIAAMDELNIPLDWGRNKVDTALKDAGKGFRTQLVATAIKARREAEKPVPDTPDSEDVGNRFGNRSNLFPTPGTGLDITAGQTCTDDSGTGREQGSTHQPVPGVPPYRGTPWEQVPEPAHSNEKADTPDDLIAELDAAATRIDWGTQ